MWSNDDMDSLKVNALSVCQQFLTDAWQDLTLEEFQFSVISGGLSNRLFRCSLPVEKEADDTKFPNEVLLRLYGPVQDDVAVIVREATVFMLLSERGMGPKLYGVFAEGRLEQYIPSRSFKSEDIRRNALGIAKELAKVHALDVPINKRPDELFKLVKRWHIFLAENVGKFKIQNEVRDIIRDDLKKEWQWLEELIDQGDWPVVFCHNDLQGGNILYRDDVTTEDGQPPILFIDFEFGLYNYRGFDVGNQFCEWCFDYNTKEFPFFVEDIEQFPDRKQQMEYFDAYLDELVRLGQEFDKDEEKQKMLLEVMLFRMASHLAWGTWAFKMALTSNINFAFSKYGETRWKGYLRCKEEYLNNVPQNGGFYISNNCNSEEKVRL